MTDFPSLSIIIPSYNQGSYIERTLLSILNQDYPGEVEIIVSDGGSTDETVSILKKYPQITWWSEPDKGFVDAVNKAFAVAKGEIWAIQSSDDFYLQDAFKHSIEALVEDPQIAIVTSSSVHIKDDRQTILASGTLRTSKITPNFLLKGGVLSQETTFFRRSVVDKIGGMREEVDTCADFDFWYRALHFFQGKYIPYYTAGYQSHDNQRTKVLDTWVDSLKGIVELCEQDPVYSSRFKMSQQDKQELYLIWDIQWGYYSGKERNDKAVALQKIQNVLDSDLYPKSTKKNIRQLGLKLGIIEEPRQYNLYYRLGRALADGSIWRKLLVKLERLLPWYKNPIKEVNVNWWNSNLNFV